MATHLPNLVKSGKLKVVGEKLGNMEKLRNTEKCKNVFSVFCEWSSLCHSCDEVRNEVFVFVLWEMLIGSNSVESFVLYIMLLNSEWCFETASET